MGDPARQAAGLKPAGRPPTLLLPLALVLTLVALFCNNVTFAKSDHLPEVVTAIACSAVALLAIGLGWTRTLGWRRTLAVVLALASAWTLMDAAGRRLPAILG